MCCATSLYDPGDVVAILTKPRQNHIGGTPAVATQTRCEERDTREISVAQAAQTVGYVFQSPPMLFAHAI